MSELISLVKDAPVMNLFIAIGAFLVVCAALGGLPLARRTRKMDHGGRMLCGGCGVAMLAASVFMLLGLKAAAARAAVDMTPSATPTAPAPAATPRVAAAVTPVPGPPPAVAARATAGIRTLLSPETYVEWGCEEARTAALSLAMPSGARFLSAEFELLQVDKAKSYVRKGPRLDPDGRSVSGEVVFRGLDRVFFNCPGGGHARLRLKVTLESP